MFDIASDLSPDPNRDGMPTMGFLDHLEELRRRLVYSIIAVAIGFVACWWKVERIYDIMQRPIMNVLRANGLSEKLVYLNPTEPFNLYLKIAALAGLFLTSPYRAVSGLDVHLSRPLPQREALRRSFHDLDHRAVHGRRILWLQSRLPPSPGLPGTLWPPVPANDHGRANTLLYFSASFSAWGLSSRCRS